jgi:hypothetical protein
MTRSCSLPRQVLDGVQLFIATCGLGLSLGALSLLPESRRASGSHSAKDREVCTAAQAFVSLGDYVFLAFR